MRPLSFALLCLASAPLLLADDVPPTEKTARPVPADHVARVRKGLALFAGGVRRTLVDNCLECHGGRAVKGEFDLSTRKALMGSGYVDATAADSHLMLLIRHTETPHMPFKAPKLPDESIAAIAAWIDLGAPYDRPLVDGTPNPRGEVTDADRQFWSFAELGDVAPPDYARSPMIANDIDRFLAADLDEADLVPNGPADRRTLIRRVFYDLIGLPPTPEQVRAFLDDARSDDVAYGAVVDELLASPHYGERWARHWMDVARFAESHGYEQDYDRPHAFHYRDYLIKSFNADQPYDEFVRWQLAGDELAPDDPLAWMATGFLGAGAFPTQLTETEFESARYDEMDDMLGTTGTAFLGLTIGCARCHDHKFDPIPNRDYYRMLATFTTTIRTEVQVEIGHEGFEHDHEVWQTQHARQQSRIRDYEKTDLAESLRKWLQTDAATKPAFSPWRGLSPREVKSTMGATLTEQADGSILATGDKPTNDEYLFTARTDLTGLRGLRLEALTDDTLTKRGPGRASNGNFALSEFTVTIRSLKDPQAKPVDVNLVDARATHQQDTGTLSVKSSIDADGVSGWAVDKGGIGKDQAAVFDFENPVGFEGGSEIVVRMNFRNNTQHALGRFRISVTTEPQLEPVVGDAAPAGVVAAFDALESKKYDELTKPQRADLLEWYGPRDDGWRELRAELIEHEKREPRKRTITVQAASEGLPHMKHHADGRGFPHFYPETHFLLRGDPTQKNGLATPGLLQVVAEAEETTPWRVTPPDGAKQSYRRSALAKWMTDVDDGAGRLVARVIVNRLWHHHFGRGIVATPSDFGRQGERPTHPELLDWLARDLVEHGWKLKRTHRLMVTSAAYRRSSAHHTRSASLDPGNRLLWRRTPRRLEAEAIRDGMLHVSGLLDETMYGKGTLDPNHRRRSIYFFIKRSELIPQMMLFDWPEHLVGIGRRGSTTIAPQALAFLNGPQCRQYAQGLSSRLGKGTLAERIDAAYEHAFSRPPNDREREATLGFVQQQTDRYATENVSAPEAESRAVVDLCQFLMSANEFVYVD